MLHTIFCLYHISNQLAIYIHSNDYGSTLNSEVSSEVSLSAESSSEELTLIGVSGVTNPMSRVASPVSDCAGEYIVVGV